MARAKKLPVSPAMTAAGASALMMEFPELDHRMTLEEIAEVAQAVYRAMREIEIMENVSGMSTMSAPAVQ